MAMATVMATGTATDMGMGMVKKRTVRGITKGNGGFGDNCNREKEQVKTDRLERAFRLSGLALFFDRTRHTCQVRPIGVGCELGRYTAALHHAGVYGHIRQPGQDQFRWGALCAVQFFCTDALDLFLRSAQRSLQQPDHQCQYVEQSVLSAHRAATGCAIGQVAGLWYYAAGDGCAFGDVQLYAFLSIGVPALVVVVFVDDGFGAFFDPGSLVRTVPRYQIRHDVYCAVADVRSTCGVSAVLHS